MGALSDSVATGRASVGGDPGLGRGRARARRRFDGHAARGSDRPRGVGGASETVSSLAACLRSGHGGRWTSARHDAPGDLLRGRARAARPATGVGPSHPGARRNHAGVGRWELFEVERGGAAGLPHPRALEQAPTDPSRLRAERPGARGSRDLRRRGSSPAVEPRRVRHLHGPGPLGRSRGGTPPARVQQSASAAGRTAVRNGPRLGQCGSVAAPLALGRSLS